MNKKVSPFCLRRVAGQQRLQDPELGTAYTQTAVAWTLWNASGTTERSTMRNLSLLNATTTAQFVKHAKVSFCTCPTSAHLHQTFWLKCSSLTQILLIWLKFSSLDSNSPHSWLKFSSIFNDVYFSTQILLIWLKFISFNWFNFSSL